MRLAGLFRALVVASAALAASPLIAAGPVVSFGARTISASRVTPNGSVVFFGVARVAIHGASMTKILRWRRVVTDVTRSGSATLDLGAGVPLFSVWAVVDATNGQFTIAAPPGYAVRGIPLTNPALLRSAISVDQFSFDHPYLDLLYVHPGKGVWYWSEMSGTRTDKGGGGGKTAVSADQAISLLGAGDKPKDFSTGGVLIAIDFMHLEVASARVEDVLIGTAR